ncbi:MAG: nucleoside deaminase [Bacteroidales bacterium]|jgi:tRNA(adenine34) deaminase|nr:nucleoside deaminase [Bacteroidales bacterium]
MLQSDGKPDERFMREALKEAYKALEKNEVPVGAVIVSSGRVIAKAHNLTETLTDVTAHAEMQAITAAASWMGGKYLAGCTLYVTLEPCVMCAGALYWSQIARVVYGASDTKRGFSLCPSPVLHPATMVISGILQEECAALLRDFFRKKRK